VILSADLSLSLLIFINPLRVKEKMKRERARASA